MALPLSGKRLLVIAEDADLSRLVAGVAIRLGAGVQALSGGRAAAAALVRGGHDVAVLDLPLADMGAAELLAACARAGTPALVVSGVYRGAQAEAALRRLGAREVFAKPFEVEALAAAVARQVGAVAPAVAEEAPDEVTGSVPLVPSEPAGGILAASPVPALDAPPSRRHPVPREGFGLPLPDAAPGRATEPEAPPPPRGDLSRTSVPRVLVALHVGQATGALTVSRGPVRKLLLLERGAPVYAASNVAAERFGALCVRRGVVASGRLEELRRADPGARTRDVLEAAGLLDPARRAELLAGQVRAVAWSTFEWREGGYDFQLGRPPPGRVPLRLDAAELVLEGLRRTATLPRLRQELPADAHLAPAPDPAFELYALRLHPGEARLLPLADGTKSVADLVRLSELPERETLAFLQACRVLRVLDEVARVLASTRRIGFM